MTTRKRVHTLLETERPSNTTIGDTTGARTRGVDISIGGGSANIGRGAAGFGE